MHETQPLATSERVYDRVRRHIEHENTLYNNRIVWLISMQAFLYATVGLMLQSFPASDPAKSTLILHVLTVICTMGIVVALICWKLLNDARGALDKVNTYWATCVEHMPEAERSLFPPPPTAGRPSVMRALNPLRSAYLPLYFILSWIAIWCITKAPPYDMIAGFVDCIMRMACLDH